MRHMAAGSVPQNPSTLRRTDVRLEGAAGAVPERQPRAGSGPWQYEQQRVEKEAGELCEKQSHVAGILLLEQRCHEKEAGGHYGE